MSDKIKNSDRDKVISVIRHLPKAVFYAVFILIMSGFIVDISCCAQVSALTGLFKQLEIKEYTNNTVDCERKSGKIFCSDRETGRGIDGILKLYSNNGVLELEALFSNGRQNGLAKEYYPSGALKTESHFTDGLPDGVTKIYSENGDLKEKNVWVKGKLDNSATKNAGTSEKNNDIYNYLKIAGFSVGAILLYWVSLYFGKALWKLIPKIFGYFGKIFKYLINAAIKAKNKKPSGRTALMKAAVTGKKDIVKLLLTRGAEVNRQDKAGDTALILAAQGGYLDIVELLIERGADIDIKDKEGKTALVFAKNNEHQEVVRALIHHGADARVLADMNQNNPPPAAPQPQPQPRPQPQTRPQTRPRSQPGTPTQVIYSPSGRRRLVFGASDDASGDYADNSDSGRGRKSRRKLDM